MPIPFIGTTWPSGHVLRSGRAADATMVATWRTADMQVNGALANAVNHLATDDGRCTVLEAGGHVVGVLTLQTPHLQFAYIVDHLQSQGLGVRAAAVLIDDYFRRTTETWLGDSGSLTTAGRRLTQRLGFSGGRLTRANWARMAPALGSLF